MTKFTKGEYVVGKQRGTIYQVDYVGASFDLKVILPGPGSSFRPGEIKSQMSMACFNRPTQSDYDKLRDIGINPFSADSPTPPPEPSTNEDPTNKENTMSTTEHSLAAEAVRIELQARAQAKADAAVAENLDRIIDLVEGAEIGDVIRSTRPAEGNSPADVLVWSLGTDKLWYETTRGVGKSSDALIPRLVGFIAEGCTVVEMTPKASRKK